MPATVSAPTQSGRRERKKQRTRRALQDAALRLVSERGFDHVTVEEIAHAVDVSTRTFFNYFASKEEAVIGHDPADEDRLRTALAARPVGELPLQSLRAVLCELAAEADVRRDEWIARRALVRSDPRLLTAHVAAWASFERTLVAGVAQRIGVDPDRDLYPALVVSAAVGATRVAVMRWRVDNGARLLELLDRAFAMLAAGLPGPAGLRGPVGEGARG